MSSPRFKSELNHGFGYAIIDTEQPRRAVTWVDEAFLEADKIADAIASCLNATNPNLNLEHEDDE